MKEHQMPKKATIGPSVDLQATLLQEGGPHDALQRQAVRTAISPSRLARAMNRIFPQAHDIVIGGISKELGSQFTPTEDETQWLKQFLSEWLQEKISARQNHKAAGATADSAGDVDSTRMMSGKS